MGIINVPVTKAGKTIPVDTDAIPEEMYALALAEGFKVLLNARMSKITTKGLEGPALEAAKEAAFKVAEENHKKVMDNAYKKGRSTAATTADGQKVSGVVMTEALRLAKAKVKDAIRAAGMKISHVEASEITKAAKEFIAADPSYIEQAKANVDARNAKPVAVDIASLIKPSPKLVKRAEEAKAAKKTILSAKQAGMTKVVPKKGSAPQSLHS